jgi:hypothetical protein
MARALESMAGLLEGIAEHAKQLANSFAAGQPLIRVANWLADLDRACHLAEGVSDGLWQAIPSNRRK